jgi:hypothetical protein
VRAEAHHPLHLQLGVEDLGGADVLPSVGAAAALSFARSGKRSIGPPAMDAVSSRIPKRPMPGASPTTSPPSRNTRALLTGSSPKISSISSRVTQMPT